MEEDPTKVNGGDGGHIPTPVGPVDVFHEISQLSPEALKICLNLSVLKDKIVHSCLAEDSPWQHSDEERVAHPLDEKLVPLFCEYAMHPQKIPATGNGNLWSTLLDLRIEEVQTIMHQAEKNTFFPFLRLAFLCATLRSLDRKAVFSIGLLFVLWKPKPAVLFARLMHIFLTYRDERLISLFEITDENDKKLVKLLNSTITKKSTTDQLRNDIRTEVDHSMNTQKQIDAGATVLKAPFGIPHKRK